MPLTFETREQIKEADTDYLKRHAVKSVGSRKVFKAEETEKGIEVCEGDATRYYFDDKEPEELPSARACVNIPKEFFSQLKTTFDPPGEGGAPMTKEEIEAIAKEVAKEVTGMRCACKNLNEIFLKAIDEDIPHWGTPGSPEVQELQANLAALAKDCGYERNVDGHWVLWPKQEAILEEMGQYRIIKEHDDGDLTLDTSASGKVVVTTEGEIFYERKGVPYGDKK